MTDKQRIFVDSYLSCGFNATQAAISAGYSQKTAYSIGERLLRNVEIRAAIDERLKEIESEKICKAEEILEFLTAVMRGEVKEKVVVQVGSKSDLRAELLDKPFSGKERLKAAEILAKINGLFNEKTEPKNNAAQILIDTCPVCGNVTRRQPTMKLQYEKVVGEKERLSATHRKIFGRCAEKRYFSRKRLEYFFVG